MWVCCRGGLCVGTIAMEILKATNGRPLDAVFVCVGGGGLIAGVAAAIKAVRPSVKVRSSTRPMCGARTLGCPCGLTLSEPSGPVSARSSDAWGLLCVCCVGQVIGVEAEDAAGMTESLRAGHVVTLEHVGLFADGAAVRVVGKETFRLCKDLVDGMVSCDALAHDVAGAGGGIHGRGRVGRASGMTSGACMLVQVTVSTDEICAGIKAAFQDTRSVLEPAGALAIAGARKYLQMHQIEGTPHRHIEG